MAFFSNTRLSPTSRSSAQAAVPVSNLTSSLTSDAIGRSNSLFRQARASDQGGNTLAAATVIPTPGRKRIVDTASRRDVDLFRLDITNPVTVRLNLRNRSTATVVANVLNSQGQIFSDQGVSLTATVPANGRGTRVFSNVQPGTYYLQISARSRAASQYELKLSVVDPSVPIDCGCGT